ncbi:MAG: A24 family peptidase [Pseudomonas sp.]
MTPIVLTLLCIQVVLSDLYARRVSNRALLVALLAGTVAIGLQGSGSPPPLQALAGLLCGLMLLPFYALRLMGAGDVKFFATLGFLLGWKPLLPIWIAASLIAGLHAIAILSASGLLNRVPVPLRTSIEQSQRRFDATLLHRSVLAARQGRQGIPYAAYLALAALPFALKGFAHG